MTKEDQILVMLEAFDLVRERLRLDFLIEELITDIGRVDYYDCAERSAKAWLVRELGGEDMTVQVRLERPRNTTLSQERHAYAVSNLISPPGRWKIGVEG